MTQTDKYNTRDFWSWFLLWALICLIGSLIAMHLVITFPKECTKSEETTKIVDALQELKNINVRLYDLSHNVWKDDTDR